MIFLIGGLMFFCVVVFFIIMLLWPEWVGISGKDAAATREAHLETKSDEVVGSKEGNP